MRLKHAKQSPELTPELQAAKRRKARLQRILVYGSLVIAILGGYLWQPMEFDFIPRRLPKPNPRIDPDRKLLESPATKILVVTAHPDDSEYFIAGTLSKLGKSARIYQIICTDGDKGYYGPFTNAELNRTQRRAEAREANQSWGGKGIQFLAHPDGRLRDDQALRDQLIVAIQRIRPDYVVAFDGDFPPRISHQDHRRAGDAALQASRATNIPRWCLLFSTLAPNFAMDVSESWDARSKLLAIHRSQWQGSKLEAVLSSIEADAQGAGESFGYSLAEPFRAVAIH